MSDQHLRSEVTSYQFGRLAAALSVGLLLFIPAIALSFQVPTVGSPPAFDSQSMTALEASAVITAFSSSLSYPQQALSEIQNATAFAAEILSRLGLSSKLTEAVDHSPDPSGLIWRKPPGSEYFDGFLQGYQMATFANDQEALVDLYYSVSGTTGGLLLAANIRLNVGSPGLQFVPPYSSAAFGIGESLGLPLATASSVSYLNSSGRCTVIYSSAFNGLDIVGCNLAAFAFDNDTGRLLGIQLRPFLEAFSSDIGITPEYAKELAVGAVRPEMVGETDSIVGDRVTGIRYTVQAAETSIGPTEGNPANNSVLTVAEVRLAYEYQADLQSASDDGLNYSVLVLVDCGTGGILLASRSPILVPSGHAYIDVGWFGVSLGLVVLFFVVMVFISPEFAWFVMGSYLLFIYVRLRGANILDNFNRGRIMGYISAKPGASFTDIRDSLKIVNGNLAYHLSVLEKLELIASAKQGRSRRFFPIGVAYPTGENHFLGKTESKILEQLDEKGPLSNTTIARFLGMSRQRIHYNLRLLQKRGLVDRLGSLWKVRPTELASVR